MRNAFKRLKQWWLLYWVRATIKYCKVRMSVDNPTDEQVLHFIRQYAGTIGAVEPVIDKRFTPNYIEVKPVAPEDVKSDAGKLNDLADQYGLPTEEMAMIYEKCNRDYVKTHKVLQMMDIAYMSDDAVLAQYDQMYQQLKHKLK